MLSVAAQDDQGRLLSLVHDAIIVSGLDGTIHHWNPGAERIYGYLSAEAVGQSIRIVYFPEDLADSPPDIANPVAFAAEGKDLKEALMRRRHKNGTSIRVSVRIAAIRNETGTIVRYITCSHDITQRIRAGESLAQSHAELERRVEERTRDYSVTRERLGHLLLSSPGVLYSCGVKGEPALTFVSENAISVLGYPANLLVLEPALRFSRIHPEDQGRVMAFFGDVDGVESRYIEYRFHRGDGAWRFLRDSARAVRDDAGRAREIVGYCVDITAEKQAEEARAERERLRLFAEALLATQESERKRISLELHDNLNQRLAALILDLGVMARNPPRSGRVLAPELERLKVEAGGISDMVRGIALELHSAGLEQFGLLAVMEEECAALSRRTGMRIAFRSKSKPAALPDAISLCLYRVAQECLRNVVRHSGARSATVTIESGGGEGGSGSIRLCVKDAGAGFNIAEARARKSLGLISMAERVRVVGGKLAIESTMNRGTRVEVTVPLRSGLEENPDLTGGRSPDVSGRSPAAARSGF